MLRDVMWMDYVQNRKALLLNVGIFLVFVLIMLTGESIPALEFIGLSCLLFSLAPMTVLVREDKFKTKSLVCSLPAKRKTIVLGRYLLGLGIGLGGGGLSILLARLLPFSTLDTSGLPLLRAVLVGTTMVVVPLSFLLPFTIRFGLIGMLVFLVGAQVLGVLVLLVSRLLGFDGLRSIFAGAGDFVVLSRSALGEIGFAVAVLALLTLFATVSCRISIGIYERREA